MSASSVLDDIVRVCEFYRESDWPFFVDLENFHVTVGEYGIVPVRGNGHLAGYLVEGPDGVTQVVDDLDSFFQSVLDWEGVD